jgi:hypothetical protein
LQFYIFILDNVVIVSGSYKFDSNMLDTADVALRLI